MVTATKNGNTHEFTDQVWERMGTGNKRMGWELMSGGVQVPVEVQVLKQKDNQQTVQPIIQATPEVVAEKPVQKKEDAVAHNVEIETPKKKKKKA